MRRILAALDVSMRTTPVLQTAIDLARQYRAPLVLFRAVDVPPEFPPAAATHHADELRPKLLADATKELDELAAVARALGVETTTDVVASTEPWRAIIDAAQSRGADAIVVGSHGYHVIDRLLGTTAARVADRAKSLVIVVHGAPAESAPASSGPYRTKS
jgi:nucleotide-binding universal stress UspA family protein